MVSVLLGLLSVSVAELSAVFEKHWSVTQTLWWRLCSWPLCEDLTQVNLSSPHTCCLFIAVLYWISDAALRLRVFLQTAAPPAALQMGLIFFSPSPLPFRFKAVAVMWILAVWQMFRYRTNVKSSDMFVCNSPPVESLTDRVNHTLLCWVVCPSSDQWRYIGFGHLLRLDDAALRVVFLVWS